MESISQGGLFNPYMKRYVSENERAIDLTPVSMEDHVKNFPKSGLTQIEYCRVNRLSYSKLVYWLRKTKSENKCENAGQMSLHCIKPKNPNIVTRILEQ